MIFLAQIAEKNGYENKVVIIIKVALFSEWQPNKKQQNKFAMLILKV